MNTGVKKDFEFSRKRIIYFILTIIIMLLGLASRKFSNYLPSFIAEYSGDTLWALMVYLGFALIFNKFTVKVITLISIIFSYGIEFSQLYQATWINNIRATTIGALVLGHGFLISDLICYTIGILLGIIIDKIIYKFIYIRN